MGVMDFLLFHRKRRQAQYPKKVFFYVRNIYFIIRFNCYYFNKAKWNEIQQSSPTKRPKKLFNIFEFQLEKRHGRRKRLKFQSAFLSFKKDQKFSISRPNNWLQNLLFSLFYDSIKNPTESPHKNIRMFIFS